MSIFPTFLPPDTPPFIILSPKCVHYKILNMKRKR